MALYEGRWDCSDCGQAEILGRHKTCTNCGNTRNSEKTPSEEPYLLPNTPEMSEAEDDWAELGPDWHCDHCSSSNAADATECKNCGAGRDDKDSLAETPEYDSLPSVGTPRPSKRMDSTVELDDVVPTDPTSIQSNLLKKYAVIGAVSLLALGAVFFIYKHFIATEDTQLTITALHWERGVEIESYNTVEEEDWEIPTGGRYIANFPAQRGTKQVFDYNERVPVQVSDGTEKVDCGTESNGNGSFKTKYCDRPKYKTEYKLVAVYRDEPVYDTKFRYEIEHWQSLRWAETSGSGSSETAPFWAQPNLGDRQRIGSGRREKYSVTLKDSQQTNYSAEVDAAVFAKLLPNMTIAAQQNAAGQIRNYQWP